MRLFKPTGDLLWDGTPTPAKLAILALMALNVALEPFGRAYDWMRR